MIPYVVGKNRSDVGGIVLHSTTNFFSFKLPSYYIKLKRTTTDAIAVLLFFHHCHSDLEVVVDAENFN